MPYAPTVPDLDTYLAGLPNRPLRILVACEYSGRVRDALIARGHDALSCDLLDTDTAGPHIMGDCRGLLKLDWDLVLAFPPCTYLAASQLWRCLPKHDITATHGNPDGWRATQREKSLEFVCLILNSRSQRLILENPLGCISTRIFYCEETQGFRVRSFEDAKANPKPTLPPTQIIQPFEYGNPESKKTCLWTRGVPLLKPTNILDIKEHGYFHKGEGKWRWQNQTGKGYNKLGENKEGTRWKIRSLTYEGVADVMAQTYTPDLTARRD